MIRAHRVNGEDGLLAVFPFFMPALLALLSVLGSCGDAHAPSPPDAVLRLQGPTMGTSWSASLHGADSSTPWQERLQDELDAIESALTTYRADSELMQLNAASRVETEEGFPVGEITWGCLLVAHTLAQATQGAFDPTIQPLVTLWGFGKERELPLPTETQIESALASTGWERFSVSFDSRVVYKEEAVQLDLSAIAKGDAADRLAALANELGCGGGLIEIGGEIRVFGERAEGGPWRVGVEAPASRPDAPRIIGSVLEIDPGNPLLQAVATSGDSRNWRKVDGIRFTHIIDPRTGRPVESPPASVTVVAPTCAIADAWATALLVLGPEHGLPLAVDAELEVCFQIRQADGSFRSIASEGYAPLVANTSSH